MKKLIMVVLAVFLMSGIASAATTMTLNGQVRVYPEMNNYGYTGGGGAPSNGSINSGTNAWTEQRAVLRFDIKSDENVGGHVAVELDSRWGNTAYVDGRGQGGGMGSDFNNFELKNSYLWYKWGDLKTTVGIQTYFGDQTNIIVSGDNAGIYFDYALSKGSALHTGVSTWWDGTNGNTRTTDSVLFIPLTVTQAIGNGKASVFLYTIQDNSNYQVLDSPRMDTPPFTRGLRPLVVNAFNTTAVIVPQTGGTLPISATGTLTASTRSKAAYEKAGIYYAGLNYGGKAGNVSYYLMGVYAFGEFKNVITNSATNNSPGTVIGDAKVSAFGLNVKGDVQLGAGKLKAQAAWVQGGGNDDPSKYRGFVSGAQYSVGQVMPLMQADLVMLINPYEIISQAQSFIDNMQNNGDGVQIAWLSYDHNITPVFNAQVVLGYAKADDLGSNTLKRQGREIGTEGNIQLRYKFSPNLTIATVAAYTKVGEYNKTIGAATEPDDVYKLQLKFQYSF